MRSKDMTLINLVENYKREKERASSDHSNLGTSFLLAGIALTILLNCSLRSTFMEKTLTGLAPHSMLEELGVDNQKFLRLS